MVRVARASTTPAAFPSLRISHCGTAPFLFDTFEKDDFFVSTSKQTGNDFLIDTFYPLFAAATILCAPLSASGASLASVGKPMLL